MRLPMRLSREFTPSNVKCCQKEVKLLLFHVSKKWIESPPQMQLGRTSTTKTTTTSLRESGC